MTTGGQIVTENGVEPASVAQRVARRIDAALAEAEYSRKWKGLANDLETKLAEREAQIAVLRKMLERLEWCDVVNDPNEADCCYECGGPQSAGHTQGCYLAKVLTSTTDAAARCVERAKAEGAEEMREAIAKTFEQEGCRCKYPGLPNPGLVGQEHWGDCNIARAAAIRALK